MLVSRRARIERFPWPVHLDEFRLAGRVRRQGRPDIWIYDHHENRGSVCVDSQGQTYKFVATPRAKGVGQFRRCSLPTALWRARLPEVVEPVSYDRRAHAWRGAPGDGAALGAGTEVEAGPGPDESIELELDLGLDEHDDQDASPEGPRVITRGHLTLIAG